MTTATSIRSERPIYDRKEKMEDPSSSNHDDDGVAINHLNAAKTIPCHVDCTDGISYNDAMPKDPPTKTNIRMLEFFSGIGGMRLALEQALALLNNRENSNNGSNKLFHLEFCRAYDISLHANKVYKHNFGTNCHNNRDDSVCTKLVEQLSPKEIEKLETNLWTMSPPCQPFTTSGKGRGKEQLDAADKRCNGLKGIIHLLSSLQEKPQWILLENVQGFGDSEMCRLWYNCLKENAYSYKSYLLSPVEFGIPNHRKRFYVLAEKNSNRWGLSELPQDGDTSEGTTTASTATIHTIVSLPKPPLGTSRNQQTLEAYMDDDPSFMDDESATQQYLVPKSVLMKPWAKGLGIVTSKDTATHCFTAGYGRIYHRSTGSLYLTTRDRPPLSEVPLDRSDMTRYEGRLRRFTPTELLRLFGFVTTKTKAAAPDDDEGDDTNIYEIPPVVVTSLEQRYKLIGNSINVTVVSELLHELLLPIST